MPPSVFRAKNNRGRRFIFGETGHRTVFSNMCFAVVVLIFNSMMIRRFLWQFMTVKFRDSLTETEIIAQDRTS